MKKTFSLLAAALICLVVTMPAFAAEASVELGQKLFNTPGLGASRNEVTCNSCHPNGKGLEHAGNKANLTEIINKCISGPLKGEALNEQTAAMQSLKMYIQSLAAK